MAKQCMNLSRSTPFFEQLRRLSSFNNNRARSGLNLFSDDPTFSDSNWSEVAKQFNRVDEFSLPGQVGVQLPKLTAKEQERFKVKIDNYKIFFSNMKHLKDVNNQHFNKLQKALQDHSYHQDVEAALSDDKKCKLRNELELKTYECPQTLLKDFEVYFNRKSVSGKPLTLVTLSFHAEHDMSTWGSAVEAERENMIQKYVGTAKALCDILQKLGFWADYIDPSSGRPANSEFMHATFFETDERYRKLGFEIEDLGCCKVISHHKWGTSAYVGCLITDAPIGDFMLTRLTSAFKGSE